jgi:hypothetical protein|tara:strand:- start:367 stop:621 length:255 start_codon:yes stop_codon:yes gene_type:complete
MTKKQVEKYITEDLDSEPRHNLDALTSAFNEVSDRTNIDAYELMELLLNNKPIAGECTHSYGFHTYQGRELIEGMQGFYHEFTN